MIEFLMGYALAGLDAKPESHSVPIVVPVNTPTITWLPDGTCLLRKGKISRTVNYRPGMIVEIED